MAKKTRRKPNGYWTLENTLKECRLVIRKEGHLPHQPRLREMNLTSLCAAMHRHGGVHKIRELLGLEDEAPERPKGYWDRERSLEKYLELTEELGHPPSSGDLNEMGLNGLACAITQKHGGYYSIRQELGLEGYRRDGFWTDERVLKTCRGLVRKYGDLPGQAELTKLAREDKRFRGLPTGVGRFGGLRKVRDSLGLEQRAKEDHYWTKKNTEEEARAVVEGLGYLPTQKELTKMGRADLASAIVKNFGFPRIRKKLGVERPRVENNYWTEDTVLKECRKVIRQEGDLPSSNRLTELGFGALASQIQRQGGYNHIRELLGVEIKVRSPGFWQDESNTLKEARRVKKEHDLERLPSQQGLAKLGHSMLASAIDRYHGGFNVFRQKLGEPIRRRPTQIKTESQLAKFLEGTPEAQEVAALASVTESTADIADVLVQMWPDRFLSAAQLARSLPSAVRKIGYSLHPFSMEKAKGFYKKTESLPTAIKYALDDLLFNIAIDQYQPRFNEDPDGTVAELRQLSRGKNGIRKLAKRVHDHYREVYTFHIPGHGRLRDVV